MEISNEMNLKLHDCLKIGLNVFLTVCLYNTMVVAEKDKKK